MVELTPLPARNCHSGGPVRLLWLTRIAYASKLDGLQLVHRLTSGTAVAHRLKATGRVSLVDELSALTPAAATDDEQGRDKQ